MGIVAGDATERAAALAKATGLEDPDRLEPGQVGIVGPDLAGIGPGRMRWQVPHNISKLSAVNRSGPKGSSSSASGAPRGPLSTCALPGPWQRSQETLGISVSSSIALSARAEA